MTRVHCIYSVSLTDNRQPSRSKLKNMKKFKCYQTLVYAGICLLLIFSPAWADTARRPEKIILNLTRTPGTSQAVTWRTSYQGASHRAQIVQISDLLNPKNKPTTVPALTTRVNLENNKIVHHHSIVFEQLEPDTRYAYRVGDNLHWSEWNQFQTAHQKPVPFTFLYFGDVQEKIHSMCSQVFRTAFQQEPESKFWLFAGDMVDNGPDDQQWEEFFTALGWIPRTLPLVLVPGNHEYPDKRKISQKNFHITRLWRPYFTLPENGPRGLEETVFSFEYPGVCFVVLNGNERTDEQAEWLKTILQKNRQPWTIVSIHQPVYSISKRRNPTAFQHLFVPLFDRFSVDLVLQGHDHGYARTFPLKNNQRVSDKEKGTVYIISNAGPKVYPVSSRYDHLMAKAQPGQLLFQSIRVAEDGLQVTAKNLLNKTIDSFDIRK